MVFIYFLLVDGMVSSRIQIWIRILEAQKLPDPASNNIKADIRYWGLHPFNKNVSIPSRVSDPDPH
jgi:hypothetical protein